jgi:hypothetical protein
MGNKSELEEIISDIKKNLKQTSVNKVDEVNVMVGMLNDPDFYIGVYAKNAGYIGQRNPRSEAVNFTKNILVGTTGLDAKDSRVLAEKYQFTKKDANFLLTNMRDFLNVYTSTGRKINIMQTANTEAAVYLKDIPSGKKCIPDKDNPGKSKEIQTAPYTKLVSVTHCPKYKKD